MGDVFAAVLAVAADHLVHTNSSTTLVFPNLQTIYSCAFATEVLTALHAAAVQLPHVQRVILTDEWFSLAKLCGLFPNALITARNNDFSLDFIHNGHIYETNERMKYMLHKHDEYGQITSLDLRASEQIEGTEDCSCRPYQDMLAGAFGTQPTAEARNCCCHKPAEVRIT